MRFNLPPLFRSASGVDCTPGNGWSHGTAGARGFKGSLQISAVGIVVAACALLLPTTVVSGQDPTVKQDPTAQTTTPQTAPKPPEAHKHAPPPLLAPAPAAAEQAPAAEPAPGGQAAPEIPKWPAFDRPVEATVVWDSHGLSIDAANSSLQAILKEVSTVTGVKVGGFSSDQRVFGAYGPGQARDVLSQLLQGSGYNVIMIGNQGEGIPREIQLSVRQAANNLGSAPRSNATGNNNNNNDEDDSNAPDEPQPIPEPMHPNFTPGVPPRSPQQLMQEMQQRQQQQQQQQPTSPPQ